MKVYVFLAEGFETIEALTPIDVFKRAKMDVKSVSITNSKEVTSSHGVRVMADILLKESDLNDGDIIIIPGGNPGYENLAQSKAVGDVVKSYDKAGKYIAAICGGPTVLLANGIGKGKTITCHRSVVQEMTGYKYTGNNIEKDGKLITAIGAGHSVDFSLALLELVADKATIERVKGGLEIK
jgi:protein deglycase